MLTYPGPATRCSMWCWPEVAWISSAMLILQNCRLQIPRQRLRRQLEPRRRPGDFINPATTPGAHHRVLRQLPRLTRLLTAQPHIPNHAEARDTSNGFSRGFSRFCVSWKYSG
ncbi:hypothetical protein QJS66_23460 (plasmid) [Kocuria rhizophila]|nr:hypothetical protein QJS66_23460 [Kocuria rhizophila]